MERTIEFYMNLYSTDKRFENYVNKCMEDEGRTLVEMMQLKTIRLVGDQYVANPAREEKPIVAKMQSGGC